jgi:hypothetical protein
MNILGARLAGPDADAHPALVSRRVHELSAIALAGAVALAAAMAIALAVPHPSVIRALAIMVGGVALLALLASPRYTLTLTILVVYLGLLDGPVKLLTASQAASAVRNVMTFAVAIGMLARLAVSRQEIKMPPLAAWVIAFSGVVVLEAFSPGTHGLLKIIGGYRQELEWVPFFFFGYIMIRSKKRFRQLFLILGVIAFANGFVAAYQSRLSPAQLQAWGPGYASRLGGENGLSGRAYVVEGESHTRPPGLGGDAGTSGDMGVIALPGLLALLTVGNLRRRGIAFVLCAGALLGIASAASRTSVIIGIVVLLSYALLSMLARLKVHRLLLVVLVALGLAVGASTALVATAGNNVLHRQETLLNTQQTEEHGLKGKERDILQLPRDITGAPFGAGLATGGSAGGFGGKQKVIIEGAGASREGALNLLVIETGVLGMGLWVALTINVIWLAVTRLRRIRDPELRTYLTAIVAAFIALTAAGFSGPTLAGTAGAFLWFAPGVVAYWLAGRGLWLARMQERAP